MATVTLLGNLFTTAAGGKDVTATPAVGDLIIIVKANTGYTAGVAPTDTNGGGGVTYTLVETRLKASNADQIDIWIRNALISSATSTTFSASAVGSSGGGQVVLAVSDMTRVGAAAKVKSGGQANQTTGTPLVTWTPGGVSATGNPIIGAVFGAINSATTWTPPTGFTEITEVNYNTPPTNLEVVAVNAGVTSASLTWGNNPAIAFAAVALELDASADATPLPLLVSRLVGM